MDEEQLRIYERLVFGHDPFKENGELRQQIWDEDGPIEGCYRIVPAPIE